MDNARVSKLKEPDSLPKGVKRAPQHTSQRQFESHTQRRRESSRSKLHPSYDSATPGEAKEHGNSFHARQSIAPSARPPTKRHQHSPTHEPAQSSHATRPIPLQLSPANSCIQLQPRPAPPIWIDREGPDLTTLTDYVQNYAMNMKTLKPEKKTQYRQEHSNLQSLASKDIANCVDGGAAARIAPVRRLAHRGKSTKSVTADDDLCIDTREFILSRPALAKPLTVTASTQTEEPTIQSLQISSCTQTEEPAIQSLQISSCTQTEEPAAQSHQISACTQTEIERPAAQIPSKPEEPTIHSLTPIAQSTHSHGTKQQSNPAKSREDIPWLLFLPPTLAQSRSYRPFSSLPAHTREYLVASVNQHYCNEMKKDNYIKYIQARLARTTCLNQALNRCINKAALPPDGACERCVKVGRVCARIITYDDEHSLCFYPRLGAENGESATWQDIKFWVT
ncbi:hypothetical protein N0V83_010838 [Neocucurbitaria cava]|uniref:Uncharacterized protein n=1 Tax=Neocucurbitaria cava TaxID=798079 RepID=A0A9W8XZI0_9PLEO|nr:hypothetical protein N0V83_010838 [Neocucurbitaria cava]